MKSKIKNIELAAERIKKAVKNKERIILYGDSDLDGISSVVILEEAIKNKESESVKLIPKKNESDNKGNKKFSDKKIKTTKILVKRNLYTHKNAKFDIKINGIMYKTPKNTPSPVC